MGTEPAIHALTAHRQTRTQAQAQTQTQTPKQGMTHQMT